jgi:hypothetical protein
MGMCWVLKEELAHEDMNIFDEDMLDSVEELVSLPF